jgi:hypothetical protein
VSTFSSNAVIVDIVTTCVLHHHDRTKWYIIDTKATNNEGNGTFFSYYSFEATIDHFLASFGPSVRRTDSRTRGYHQVQILHILYNKIHIFNLSQS